jgi:hypothetical protein
VGQSHWSSVPATSAHPSAECSDIADEEVGSRNRREVSAAIEDGPVDDVVALLAIPMDSHVPGEGRDTDWIAQGGRPQSGWTWTFSW